MQKLLVKDIVNLFNKKLHLKYPAEEITTFIQICFSHLLDWKAIDIHTKQKNEISNDLAADFKRIIERLEKNEPIQYILGEADFYGLKFKVNESVLIPRQETELLVHEIVSKVKPRGTLLDIGTGSGCISVSIAKNLPDLKVWAVDISFDALEVAQKNAMLNNIEVEFVQDDILLGCPKVQQQFDVIVSNPPYVTQKQKEKMHANVLDYEPGLALFVSDDDPLIYYKAILKFAQTRLIHNGLLFIEINEIYGEETAGLFREDKYVQIEIIKDLNGKNRFVKGTKNG